MEVIHRNDSHPLQSPRHVNREDSQPLPQIQAPHETHSITQVSPASTNPPRFSSTMQNGEMDTRLASRSPSVGSWTDHSRHTPSPSPARDPVPTPQNIPQTDGQNHDRMETDEEEDQVSPSGSETPGPSNDPSHSSPRADVSPDEAEPMDIGPDEPDLIAVEAGFPPAANDLQVLMDEQVAMGLENEDLARITAGEGMLDVEGVSAEEQEAALNAILDRSPAPDAAPAPTAIGPDGVNQPSQSASNVNGSEIPVSDASDPQGNVATQGDDVVQGNEALQRTTQTVQATNGGQEPATTQDATMTQAENAGNNAPPTTEGVARNEPAANNDDAGDSSDEEENPYWAEYKQDTSSPDDQELKEMKETRKPDALDHTHWEKKIFEPLEDPEYAPDEVGRIEWTVKGVHGTPEKPNRESIMYSPSVQIGGFYWHIKYFPRGNERTDNMSLYIECSDVPHDDADSEENNESGENENQAGGNAEAPKESSVNSQVNNDQSVPAARTSGSDASKKTSSTNTDASPAATSRRWEVPAQIGCVVYNPLETSVYVQRRSCHRFHHETEDWGWTRFTGPWCEMHRRKHCERKPLLQDDTVSFTAYIRTFKDHTGSLWWHPPNDREWDSHERFGLRSLQSDILSPPALPAAFAALATLDPFARPLIQALNQASGDVADRRPSEVISAALQITDGMTETGANGSDVSLHYVAELLKVHCSELVKMDVVEMWENLRFVLSVEAAGLAPGSDAPDIFPELAMIRQPDRIALSQNHKSQVDNGSQSVREPNSLQQTLDSIFAPSTLAKMHPSVIMVELHRQEYLQNSRRWRKMTHKIGLEREIEVPVGQGVETEKAIYLLFGMIVHSGGLESNHYSTIIQPEGPGTRWIKYGSMFDEKKAECLTTKQVFERYEGKDGADENTAVAYIAMYARSDQVKATFLLSSYSADDKAGKPSTDNLLNIPDKSTSKVQADQTETNKDKDEVMPIQICNSESFTSHTGRGLLDPWASRPADSTNTPSNIFSVDITSEKGVTDTDERILEVLKDENPDEDHKFSIFGLDYDPKYFLRGPPPFLSYHSMKALENPITKLQGCQLWLHKLSSEEKSIVEEVRSRRKRQKLSHDKAKDSSEQPSGGTAGEDATQGHPSTGTNLGNGNPSSSAAHSSILLEDGISAGAGAGPQPTVADAAATDLSSLPSTDAGGLQEIDPSVEQGPGPATPSQTDAPATPVQDLEEPRTSSRDVGERQQEPVAPVDEGQTGVDQRYEAIVSSQNNDPVTASNNVPNNVNAGGTRRRDPLPPLTLESVQEVYANYDRMMNNRDSTATGAAASGAAAAARVDTAINGEQSDASSSTTNGTSATGQPEAAAQAAETEDIIMGGTEATRESADSKLTTAEEPKDGPECSEDLQDYTYILVKRFNPHDQSLKGISSFYCNKNDRINDAIRKKLSLGEKPRSIEVYQERGLLISKSERISDNQTFSNLQDRSEGRIFVIQDRLSRDEKTDLASRGLPPSIPLYFSTLLALENPVHRTPTFTRHYFSSPYLSTPQSHSLPHGPTATSISLAGDHYVGPYMLGTKTGPNGTLTYATSGDTYSGEFSNDLPQGQGMMHYARTGNIYEGGWKKGKWYGKGVMKFERAEAEARECAICWEEEMNTAVMPCGHLVACEGCARQVEQCPVCRRGVSGVLRIWVS